MKRYGVLFSLIMVGSMAAMEHRDEEDCSPQATSPRKDITGVVRHPGESPEVISYMNSWYESKRKKVKCLVDFNKVREIENIYNSRENSPAGSPCEEYAFEHEKPPTDISNLPVIAQHAWVLANMKDSK